MEICTYGDAVLETPTLDVMDFDDKKELIDAMFETMYAANGVGLAAPQIGLGIRLFIWDDRDGFEGHIFNPFLMKSPQRKMCHEGCLSLPGLYLDDVMRSHKAILTGHDINGNFLSYSVQGLAAQIMQHEFDHLDGKLFLARSKMTPNSKRRLEEWKDKHLHT